MISSEAFWQGVRAAIPVYLPAFPFGLIIGLTIAETNIPNLAGFLTGSLIFGGAAQFAAITLLAAGATGLAALAAALVVNARHVMYSAALVPHYQGQPRWFRFIGPYLLIDQTFAMVSTRETEDRTAWRSFYLGAGALFWVSWQVTMAIGLLAGDILPAEVDVEFAIPAMFIGLVVPGITRRPAALAAVAGAITTAVLWQVPNRGGMLLGALVGAIVGYLAEGSE